MFRTIFRKLLVVLLGFGVMMTMIFAAIMEFSHQRYHLELDQRAASTLAGQIAARGVGGGDGIEATGAMQAELERLSAVIAGVDLYVLDAHGKILASSVSPARVKQDRVDMTPIRRYLAGDTEFPILGIDPSDPSRDDVFSAASISGDVIKGPYLYALLHRREHQPGAALIRAGYLVGEGAWIVAGGTLFAILSSIVIVRLLTRRLTRLTAKMEKYSQSGFTEPLEWQTDLRSEADDELGRLGRLFAEMAQRIVEQMEELKRTDAMRRELLASISQDLRRPLTSVQSYLESLAHQEIVLGAEEKQEYLEIAARKTARMAKLVTRLSELAGFEARQVSLASESFVLPDVVQDVMQKFSRGALQKGVSLRAAMAEHLPLACGDSGLIERVLDNLVENALRYTPAGGAVEVRVVPAKQRITVEVADTGMGIRPEDLPRIFDRSFRSEVHRPGTADNAGFGLAIVKSILRLHGSEFRVESTMGVGTTFQFDIRTRAGMLDAANHRLELATGPIRLRQPRP